MSTCNQEWVKLLNDKKFAGTIKEVEHDFKFNGGMVSNKASKGQLEECLYATLVLGENKKAVIDELYYHDRSLSKNEKDSHDFLEGFVILSNIAQQSFGVINNELTGI